MAIDNPESNMSIVWRSERAGTVLHEHGHLSIYHNPRQQRLSLANIVVEPKFRREGIATGMLEVAEEQALQLGVVVMTAAIVSRESLDLMTRFFGEDAIEVRRIGEYRDPEAETPSYTSPTDRGTLAYLTYPVEPAAI